MAHYVCNGQCKGVSMNPNGCQTPDCEKKGQPMSECNCTDGQHSEVFEGRGPEETRAEDIPEQ